MPLINDPYLLINSKVHVHKDVLPQHELLDLVSPSKEDQMLNDDQMSLLSNEYDFMITRMYRMYLQFINKQHHMSEEKKVESVDHINQVCNKIIKTFNKLIKTVFPLPGSDFELA